jgi:hypothetical protein
MKLLKTVRLTGALLAGTLLSLFSANSFALTAGGVTISNIATVNYQVGGNAQTPIGSSSAGNTSGAGTATTFVVDNKLNLVVTTVDVADVQVSPAGVHVVLEYLVTNSGNETQGVSFSTLQKVTSTASPFGGNTDNFDATLTNAGDGIFVQKTFSGSAYAAGTDTATSIPQLIATGTAHVFVVADIPAVQVDGDVSVIALVGQVAVAGAVATYGTAPGADITADNAAAAWVANPTVGNEQVLFADAAGTDDVAKDGKSSSRDAFIVKSAKLTITKGVPTILSDPTGDATPHAIPGAVVKYTVTIGNAASATTNATSIALTDALPGNTTWGTATVGTLAITTPGVNTGTNFTCPDGSVHTQVATGGAPYTTVSCDFAQTTPGTVTVSGVALKPGDTTTITYTVTIN